MAFWRFIRLTFLKYILVLAVAFTLSACSSAEYGAGGNTGASTVINLLGISWTAPSEREDNSALSLSEIAGFRIYYGTEAGDYQNQIDINDSSSSQAQVEDLASGTYYVVVTTVDTDGRESLYSPEVVITL